MDPASIAAALIGAQTSRAQFAAAAAMMRMNADSAQSVAQLVQSAAQNASQSAAPRDADARFQSCINQRILS
jgi:type IV secretory pathway TrbL component